MLNDKRSRWYGRMDDARKVGRMAKRTKALSRLRGVAGAAVIETFFSQLASLSRYQPYAKAHRHGVELIRDVPYLNSGARDHLLDIYRPTSRPGPWPVVIYMHGGGFRILSKDSHWLMALSFAKRGYLVFNINYRLAPQAPYPAALQDACAAYRWVVRNAAAFGGDLNRLVLAGESAGANLATSVALATAYERPEPWARQVFETAVQPRVVVPACGIFQVSDAQRFHRAGLSPWIADYISLLEEGYLAGSSDGDNTELADPVCFLERNLPPARSLPAFFLPVGTRDPIIDDTRRMAQALERHRVDVEAKYYDGEMHAFHAFIWRRNARHCWRDTFDFLAHRLDAVPAAGKAPDLSLWVNRAHLRST